MGHTIATDSTGMELRRYGNTDIYYVYVGDVEICKFNARNEWEAREMFNNWSF